VPAASQPGVRALASVVVAGVLLAGLPAGSGCSAPIAPANPTWADVSPVLRGECVSCHGWTATDRPPNAAGVHPPNTGGSLRLDFYDLTPDVCGDAVLALDPGVSLAGSPGVTLEIARDVVRQAGAGWPTMPPQPGPALQDWELETIERWSSNPVKGPPPAGNRPPTIAVNQLPSVADQQLSFTAIVDDPDNDSVVGVVEVGGLAFLMNRSGSFDVVFDSSAWPAGLVTPTAILCDGWSRSSVDLGPIAIQH
jgi:hypothetical protein